MTIDKSVVEDVLNHVNVHDLSEVVIRDDGSFIVASDKKEIFIYGHPESGFSGFGDLGIGDVGLILKIIKSIDGETVDIENKQDTLFLEGSSVKHRFRLTDPLGIVGSQFSNPEETVDLYEDAIWCNADIDLTGIVQIAKMLNLYGDDETVVKVSGKNISMTFGDKRSHWGELFIAETGLDKNEYLDFLISGAALKSILSKVGESLTFGIGTVAGKDNKSEDRHYVRIGVPGYKYFISMLVEEKF